MPFSFALSHLVFFLFSSIAFIISTYTYKQLVSDRYNKSERERLFGVKVFRMIRQKAIYVVKPPAIVITVIVYIVMVVY